MIPSDEDIRDAARNLAPELTATLGAAESAVPDGVALRILWARAHASIVVFATYQTLALAYLLAHACTVDLAGSQGSTSAPIGSGATAGATTSTSVGGMSESYGASGVVSAFTALSISDAALAATQYGRGFLSLRGTRSKTVLPFHR